MRAPGLLRRHRTGAAAIAALALLGTLAAGVPAASGGFTAKVANPANTVGTAKYFTCHDAIAPDLSSAYFEWPLNDASGSTSANDISGNSRSGTYVGTMTSDASTPIGCPRDPGGAWQLDGATTAAYLPTSVSAPQVFTIEATFQTSAKQGKIIGFGNKSTGASTSYDRHLYITTAGKIAFGVYSGNPAYHVITSTAVVTDGAWHHVAATLSSNGMKLYLDGVLTASDPSTTVAETNTGYWRVGYDNVSGWTGASTSGFFAGRLRNVGVYNVELTAQQIADHAAPTFGS